MARADQSDDIRVALDEAFSLSDDEETSFITGVDSPKKTPKKRSILTQTFSAGSVYERLVEECRQFNDLVGPDHHADETFQLQPRSPKRLSKLQKWLLFIIITAIIVMFVAYFLFNL